MSSSPAAGSGGTSATPPSGPSGSGPGNGGARGSGSRLGEWAALISAFAAVAGVALGFLGLPALVKSPTARPAPTATVYVTVTPTPPAASTPGPPAAGPGAIPSPNPSATVPSQPASGGTTLALAEGYGFRLRGAAPAVERYSGALDFYRNYAGVHVENNARIVALTAQETGTLETCKSVTRFVRSLDIDSLEAGMRFCFESGKGSLALVELPKNGDRTDSLELRITFLGTR